MNSSSYERLVLQAAELRSIASEMQKSKALSNAIDNTSAAWQGATADSFIRKCGALTGNVRAEAAKIAQIADQLEQRAKTLHDSPGKTT